MTTEWHFTDKQEAKLVAKACLIASHGVQQDELQQPHTDQTLDYDDRGPIGEPMVIESGLPSLKRNFLERLLRGDLRSVGVDYDFHNSKEIFHKMKLKAVYSQMFEQALDAMALYQACIEGKLHEFCAPWFGHWEEEKSDYFKDMMLNPYPLNPPRWYAGLVVEEAFDCKESNRSAVQEHLDSRSSETVLIDMPDQFDKDTVPFLAEYNPAMLDENEFHTRGTEPRMVRLSPDQREKVRLVEMVVEDGSTQEVLIMGRSRSLLKMCQINMPA